MSKLKEGDKIPEFSLPDQNGDTFNSKTLLGKKSVIFFYPKNNTSVCTAEVCGFRDNFEAFQDAGAEVIGISSDSVESHGKFAQSHRLPFTLLSDKDKEVRRKFGVPGKLFGIIPGRVTYIVDASGTISKIYSNLSNADAHIKEAKKTIEEI